jgi:hypothetical protein
MKARNMRAAKEVERRPVPPLLTLIVDWPIIASPPIDWNMAETRLATPCARRVAIHRISG